MERGDWMRFKTQFDMHPSAQTRAINLRGETFLRHAIETGNVYFVRELVNLMAPEDLELQDICGDQALISAATGGIKEIAEIMLAKNSTLAGIPNRYGLLPVVIAAKNGNDDMAKYLYSATPLKALSPETSKNGARLVLAAITSDMYDIALDLLHNIPELAIACDSHRRNAATVLAEKPSSFPSGYQHGYLEGTIYRGIALLSGNEYLERLGDSRPAGIKAIGGPIGHVIYSLRGSVWKAVKHISVPCFRIKDIHAKQFLHTKALEVLEVITTQLSALDESKLPGSRAYRAILTASKFGIVEMVSELIKCNPNLQFSLDEQGRDIFQVAVLHRQEKVFNLIYEMRNKKMITLRGDVFDNTLLHTAGLVAPSSQLDKISGAALQMQRELQWFKEVERLVPPRFKEERNKDYKTPRELFTENHEKMVKAGEGWMKKTAESCMVVTALIATVMFTAAFTVPGGNNSETGLPVLVKSKLFMIFILTDALSLFCSLTSLLMFLAILTSCYAEEDFLVLLPRKLILGLTTLIFSVVFMLATFCATIFVVLEDKFIWVAILSTVIASVPVVLFARLQLPLLLDMVCSTLGSSIFGKNKKGILF